MSATTYLLDKFRQLRPTLSNRLCHVASYTRELPVSLERMYENAVDGEHLPFLHSSTFSFITITASGAWGWRAKSALQPASFFNRMEFELTLDREKNRWVTRTLSGLGKGTEVWTHAIPLEKNKIKVIVDFYIPKLPRALKDFYARHYEALYAQLYDEDLWMMSTRQTALDQRAIINRTEAVDRVALGELCEIQEKLPYIFSFNARTYRIVESRGELIAHSMSCPHMLGPLQDAETKDGVLECPWHGYQFDLRTRACISGQKCNLAPAPKLSIDEASKLIYAEKPD